MAPILGLILVSVYFCFVMISIHKIYICRHPSPNYALLI
jgi:hypothetical protein